VHRKPPRPTIGSLQERASSQRLRWFFFCCASALVITIRRQVGMHHTLRAPRHVCHRRYRDADASNRVFDGSLPMQPTDRRNGDSVVAHQCGLCHRARTRPIICQRFEILHPCLQRGAAATRLRQQAEGGISYPHGWRAPGSCSIAMAALRHRREKGMRSSLQGTKNRGSAGACTALVELEQEVAGFGGRGVGHAGKARLALQAAPLRRSAPAWQLVKVRRERLRCVL
jgi:hypothetical protein